MSNASLLPGSVWEENNAKGAGDATRPSSRVKHLRWGIFEVAYGAPPQRQTPVGHPLRVAQDLRNFAPFAAKLIRELYSIAPMAFMVYVLGCLWTSIASALSLYLTSVILVIIEDSMVTRRINDLTLNLLQFLVFVWLFSALLSTVADRIGDEMRLRLCGHLRAHFLPKLAQATLRLDIIACEDPKFAASLPEQWAFEEVAPGWNVVERLSRKICSILTINLQIIALILAISRKRSPELQILAFFSIAHPVLLYLTPSNGIGGAGYTFWTKNIHYHRLAALYSMVFSPKYRQDLTKDGTTRYLAEEFERTSKHLGAVKPDATVLAYSIPRSWHWDLLNNIMVDFPLAAYAVTLPWSLSPSSLATMALLQYATDTLRKSIILYMGDPTSFVDLLSQAKRLYRTLEFDSSMSRGTAEYPDPVSSSSRGMKVSFRNVCLQYPKQEASALNKITFEIQPGQLVVIVGVNGSGKSSLLKLLPRLMDPTSGEIFIDDKSLAGFDLDKLRSSMAFLTQSQEIYPLSLCENIQLGLSGRNHLGRDKVDEAAQLGGSYDMIKKLGYHTVLDPISTFGQSPYGSEVSTAAVEEREIHLGRKNRISISGGEEQRLFASRTFMRLKNSNIKLLVVDEPMSSLDPLAELDILTRFRDMREGKTTIFVTHRFGHLVKHADMIFCMDAGRIVERGTHSQLMMNSDGVYTKLYNVQAQGFE